MKKNRIKVVVNFFSVDFNSIRNNHFFRYPLIFNTNNMIENTFWVN